MMLDLGAAPNPTRPRRGATAAARSNGSAHYDPPLWEYRAKAPRPVTVVERLRRAGSRRSPRARPGTRPAAAHARPHRESGRLRSGSSTRTCTSRTRAPAATGPRTTCGTTRTRTAVGRRTSNKLYNQERGARRSADADAVPRLPGRRQVPVPRPGPAPDFTADQAMLDQAKRTATTSPACRASR